MNNEQLEAKLKELLNLTVLPSIIKSQIRKYVTERGWSYLEIARAVAYYVVVQKQVPQPKYGIGIVPHIMDEAKEYFRLEQLRRQKQERQAERHQESENNYDIVCMEPVRRRHTLNRPINLGNLREDDT